MPSACEPLRQRPESGPVVAVRATTRVISRCTILRIMNPNTRISRTVIRLATSGAQVALSNNPAKVEQRSVSSEQMPAI
jgi:hypothetical protein